MNELAELIKAHQDSGPEEAILHYLNAYQKNPNDELAYLIGICYGQIGQPKKSMEYFDKISQASYRVLNAKAGAAITSRDYNTAEELLTQSITLKPDNANAYAALARLFSSKREYTRAITHLQKAITIAPKVADYHYNLGLAYQNSYRIEDALTAFKTAVNYDVKHPAAWRGRGLCLEIKSDFKGALDAYQRSWNLDEHPLTAHGIGRCHTALNDYNEAILYLNKAVSLGDESLECQHNLASVYHIQGHQKQALIHWHFCLERQNTLDTSYNIACAYQHLQNYEQAKLYFQTCLDKDPKHKDTLLNMAAIALDEHKPKEAVLLYKKVLEIDPDCTDAVFVHAALTNKSMHSKAPPSYIKSLFDQYASHYDKHLQSVLKYQLPSAIDELISRYQKETTDTCLDLGCGTGLIGQVLRPYCKKMIGVDLSSDMLKQADSKQIYDQLIHSDVLSKDLNISADIVVAADLLPYFGDLNEVLMCINALLKKGALVIISFEKSDKQPYQLHKDVRFSHHPDYVRACIEKLEWSVADMSLINLRQQQGKPVSGYLLACMA